MKDNVCLSKKALQMPVIYIGTAVQIIAGFTPNAIPEDHDTLTEPV